MAVRHISNHEMARRKLVADAQSFLSFAMGEFSTKHGELTPAEWQNVMLQKMQWMNAMAIKDEWKK